MTKTEERSKLVKAMGSENFIESCEKQGFTINSDAKESKGKKKANI